MIAIRNMHPSSMQTLFLPPRDVVSNIIARTWPPYLQNEANGTNEWSALVSTVQATEMTARSGVASFSSAALATVSSEWLLFAVHCSPAVTQRRTILFKQQR